MRLGNANLPRVERLDHLVGMECSAHRRLHRQHRGLVLQPLWRDGLPLHLETRKACPGIHTPCDHLACNGVGIQLCRGDDLPMVAPWPRLLGGYMGGAVVRIHGHLWRNTLGAMLQCGYLRGRAHTPTTQDTPGKRHRHHTDNHLVITILELRAI